MSEPVLLFMERAGPWRQKYAWLPVKLYDGTWIWLELYHRALYQTKTHLDGPVLNQFVNSDHIIKSAKKPIYKVSH